MNQRKMLIVAISGKQRSGKTWCSDRLIRDHGFQRFSFAGPLKDDIRAMGFPEGDIEDKPPWMRRLMQVYGQAWRAVRSDHWAHQLRCELGNALAVWLGKAHMFRDGVPIDLLRIVIDDMRFINEAEMLQKFGEDPAVEVRLIRLERFGDPGDVSHTEDVSETELDDYHAWWQTFSVKSGELGRLNLAADRMVR